MVQVVSKWFARVVLALAALLCLCFLPLSFFVGVMSVGRGPSVPVLSFVIIFFPVLVAGLLGIALVWLEYHPRYFPHGAVAIGGWDFFGGLAATELFPSGGGLLRAADSRAGADA